MEGRTLKSFDLSIPVRADLCSRTGVYASAPKHISLAEVRIAEHRLGIDPKDYPEPVCGIVIGENPGPNTHWAMPLFPWPSTSSAGRLVAMSGMTPAQYLGGLYRRNLVDDKLWSPSAAQHRARDLITALFDLPRMFRVILLGTKVAKAFNVPQDFWEPHRLDSRQLAVVVPHPSGMNRLYNIEANRRLTGEWLRWAALGGDRP